MLRSGLRDNARALGDAFELEDADLARRYAPDKWSIREVLAHVADCEFVNGWRFARAVLEPGSSVEPFDQDRWAAGFAYAERPVALSRALFEGARKMLLHSVETMADDVLDGACRHPEKGEMSGWEWAELILAHGEHHRGQIQAALQGRSWVPVVTDSSWRYTGQAPPQG